MRSGSCRLIWSPRSWHEFTLTRLHLIASDLLEHLLSNQPDWGNWPNDVGEAVYISIILKIWLREAIAAEKPNLTKQELDQLEQSVLERIVKRKEQDL